MPDLPSDADEVLACEHLVDRTGARGFEIGYIDDDPADPRWYAHAQYRGTRLCAEGHATPEAAADALALRLLDGAQCRCGRLVATSPVGAMAYQSTLLHTGRRWTTDEARRAGQCLWRREGHRWQSSCDAPPVTIEGRR